MSFGPYAKAVACQPLPTCPEASLTGEPNNYPLLPWLFLMPIKVDFEKVTNTLNDLSQRQC